MTIRSHPEAAAVVINGGPPGRYTPAPLDTIQGNYTVRLSLLGYADTTFTVMVAAVPDTITANLKALPGTPGSVSSWSAPTGSGYTECLALDASGGIQVEVGEFGSGVVQHYSASGTPLSSWTFNHQDDGYSAMAVDPSGNTYLSPYYGGFVAKYNAAGSGVGAFGDPSAFSSPVGGLTLDPSGDTLFVVSTSRMSALRSSDGMRVRFFEVIQPEIGRGPIVRDGLGRFYFAPDQRDSVLRTDGLGNRLSMWSVTTGVAAMALAPDGSLYIASGAPGSGLSFWNGHGPGRVMQLSPSGTVIRQWATEHIIPSGIAVSASGDVYVTDFYRGVYTGNPNAGVYRWSDH